MTHTELERRLRAALGEAYASFWSQQHVLMDLGSHTVAEALAQGWSPKEVWAAVWAELELPDRDR